MQHTKNVRPGIKFHHIFDFGLQLTADLCQWLRQKIIDVRLLLFQLLYKLCRAIKFNIDLNIQSVNFQDCHFKNIRLGVKKRNLNYFSLNPRQYYQVELRVFPQF